MCFYIVVDIFVSMTLIRASVIGKTDRLALVQRWHAGLAVLKSSAILVQGLSYYFELL